MKKSMIAGLMLATAAPVLIPAAAQAQSRAELKRDRQDIRQEQRQLDRAVRSGDRRDIRDERRDVRDAKREYREDLSDYRRHRASHSSDYRAPKFRASFKYRALRPGLRIPASYYGSRYQVADYWRYRLPRPAYGTVWVRHYNDVLLVNSRSGAIIRVIPNLFW
ncbi:MAG: RcnB family protein [Blastomonas sp.]